jgi:uncharacterized Tic20 family protein
MTDHPTPALNAPNDRTLAILAHLGGFFTGFIAPLILFLIKKTEPDSQFDTEHAKEALNFQITVWLALFASAMLTFILIGLLLIPVIVVANFILCIMGAVKASNGQTFRYPLTLRLIK